MGLFEDEAYDQWPSKKNTVLKSHGRPPWYGQDGKRISDAFVIGIAGGSASGKTHVARQIVRSLGNVPTVIILSQDSFYNELDPEQHALAHQNRFDFDHPSSIDMPMFAACLSDLKACKQTNIPIYSFTHHQRLKETKYLYGASIIIAEGIMALQDPGLRDLYDLKVFVQCDSDLMLARRIQRDVKERGRSVEGVLEQYLRYVKPAFDNFVQPTSKYADIVVPGSNNSVAIELIATHIRRQMTGRASRFRKSMTCKPIDPESGSAVHHPNLIVLKQTPQVKGIYTILRDQTTKKQDFVFFVDRLATFLIEKAMEHLPYRRKAVETPIGAVAEGSELDVKNICGVSILRSGGPLEKGLTRVLSDVRVGSLLVQSDVKTGEPLLLHVMLPVCVRERHLAEDAWVFLLDAQIGTGASAFMAIRTLLDHGVREEHIIFVTFLVARSGGVAVLARAFPRVRIVCGAVDDVLRETWLDGYEPGAGPEVLAGAPGTELSVDAGRKAWIMEPGMGQIGDRYYL
ncbi:armadillo beta-catenin plakoglobin [Coniophora puteana RWD-64-598 SS2]|uniref:Uridine kinase n=1 Tax=Coniophora puteana (strain RWD-64-598) TaxID=741705 RepID=A0A5M3N0F0_CONPW|nr:armadillo beta-catenin plakoglobin [Coniophora puteana RWD-64-598 SS2]EIW84385.1 armadillo beta-catenin plakoglobin [Coniophora puteana RWD-64-598 SS2]